MRVMPFLVRHPSRPLPRGATGQAMWAGRYAGAVLLWRQDHRYRTPLCGIPNGPVVVLHADRARHPGGTLENRGRPPAGLPGHLAGRPLTVKYVTCPPLARWLKPREEPVYALLGDVFEGDGEGGGA